MDAETGCHRIDDQKKDQRNERLPEEFLHNAQPDSFRPDSPPGSYQLSPAACPAGENGDYCVQLSDCASSDTS
ncbi:hypothetical protein [Massilia pinisoli]|uniref:hypothetical protein n=1 Tax=Massilia pinisoli TaxID=1772194 RepID=UPI00351D9988